MTEEILLVAAVSVDAFLASFAYGADKIRIPWLSAMIINIIGTAVLIFSLLASKLAGTAVSPEICRWMGFLILMFIGTASLFQNGLKSLLKKKREKKLSFSISGIGFVVSVFLDETCADTDKSKSLSPKEALVLALALSADSLGSGFGAGLSGANITAVCVMSFAAGIAAVAAGSAAGRRIGGDRPGAAWISGVFLILLAVIGYFKG